METVPNLIKKRKETQRSSTSSSNILFYIWDAMHSIVGIHFTSVFFSVCNCLRIVVCLFGEENTGPQLFKLCLVPKQEGGRNEEPVERCHKGKSSVKPNRGRDVTCYSNHTYDAKYSKPLKKKCNLIIPKD